MAAGNILYLYFIKSHNDLCAICIFCYAVSFLCRQVKHNASIGFAICICMLCCSHRRNNRTVCCCDFGSKATLCTMEIQHDLIVGNQHFFPILDFAICLNGKYLTCCFVRRNRNLIQRNVICLRFHRRCYGRFCCRFFCGDFHCAAGVIPCDIQIQRCCQCTDRQHGSVIYDHGRHIHFEFAAVLITDFVIDFKHQCIVVIDDIYLLCRFVPYYFAAQFRCDLTHRQHRSAVNGNRRHILWCHGFAVDGHLDLRCIIGMIFSVIV